MSKNFLLNGFSAFGLLLGTASAQNAAEKVVRKSADKVEDAGEATVKGTKKAAKVTADKAEDAGEATWKGTKKAAKVTADKAEDAGEATWKGTKKAAKVTADKTEDAGEATAHATKKAARQLRHLPHTTWPSPLTIWPGKKSDTLAPTSTISPTNSWPITMGVGIVFRAQSSQA